MEGQKPSDHYLNAYIAKINGGNRLQVARAFYKAIITGKTLDAQQDEQARQLAINRTGRLYRHGGHSSQVLDYVEQSVVCDILARQLKPAQADALLLGSTSFCLQDSVLLHRYGLITLPQQAPISPARDVMRVFMAQGDTGAQAGY